MPDYPTIACEWIHKKDLWQTVRAFRKKYWPENILPVDMEKIVEQRLGLDIDPTQSLLTETSEKKQKRIYGRLSRHLS